MKYSTLSLTVILVLIVGLASILLTQTFAQDDQRQMDDSMSMTESSNNLTSPAIYEIPNSSAQVKLTWQPEAINTNETTKFTFAFIDSDNGQPLQNVSFSVHMSLDGKSMGHAHEGTAPEGIGTIEQKFDSTGSLSIVVESIKAGNNTPIAGFAQFNVSVVPEFPLTPTIIMGAVLCSFVAVSRAFKSLSQKYLY